MDDVEIRSILTPDNPEKENPGYGKPTTGASHNLHAVKVSVAAYCGICRYACRHCLGAYQLYRQQCPLAGLLTTALSIVGMWMLARKYVEQWWAWIGVDAVSTGLYIYKGLDFTAALYGLYTIIAIFGYFKWKKLMKKEADL